MMAEVGLRGLEVGVVDEEARKPCLAKDSRPEDEMKPPVGRAESDRVKRRCSSAKLGCGDGSPGEESNDVDINQNVRASSDASPGVQSLNRHREPR